MQAHRKTFSGRGGRPRKEGPRQPNGQPKRSKTEERSQILSVVLSQPHRKGSDHHWLETPLGRLLRDGRVYHSSTTPDDLWRAAEEYSEAFANMRRVWASRRPWAVTEGGRPPRDVDLMTAQEMEALLKREADIKREWGDMNRCLRDAGEIAKKAVEHLLQDAAPDEDEKLYAFWLTHGAGVGLAALAKMLGIVK